MSERLKLLILGGYGTFGGRIVQLLENKTQLEVIVAGRSFDKASAYCQARGQAKAQLTPALVDRNGNMAAQIESFRPHILVDASGPFQAYGDREYRVVEACLKSGVNYLDIADSSNFVDGIGAYDKQARAAGTYVLSGVSTCPVLTAAVVRHLSFDMNRISAIRGGIAPGPSPGVGENVVRAIASYAGRPVQLKRSGKVTLACPFTEQMRFTIAPPGRLPLQNRLFSLADVPDLRVLGDLWPETDSIWMGVAPVPESMHRLLIAFSWLVRLKLLSGLSLLAPLMHFVTTHFNWGERRSGMFVEVDGKNASGLPLRRSWHLIAEESDGLFVPAMAVAALVRRSLEGRPPAPGARAAARELELEDYEKFFAARRICTGTRDDSLVGGSPLYARILSSAWDALPSEIRSMHDNVAAAQGRASVERGRSVFARMAATLVGFPKQTPDSPVKVQFEPLDGGETWRRTFGDESFSSRQFVGRGRFAGLLCERFGPLTFGMALVLDNARLLLLLRRWSAFGIPLPMWLCPSSNAYEMVEQGRFCFRVEIRHRFVGLIVRYQGWLVPAAAKVPLSALSEGSRMPTNHLGILPRNRAAKVAARPYKGTRKRDFALGFWA